MATIVSIVWHDHDLVARFGPGLATESIGILLTVLIVRRFMEQAERLRRLRSSTGALRKSRRALHDLVDIWATTFKGCLAERQAGEFTQIAEFLTPDRSEVLLSCDPWARRAGGDRWLTHAAARITDAQTRLEQIVDAYGGMLDPEYIEALDALITDPFLHGFADLARAEVDMQPWRLALNAVRGLRMTHFERLRETVELHNRLAVEVGRIRGSVATQRTSVIGVQLSPDHDLRVDTALDEGWWRSMPQVGSLRPQNAPA
jgi:hypothetical protein